MSPIHNRCPSRLPAESSPLSEQQGEATASHTCHNSSSFRSAQNRSSLAVQTTIKRKTPPHTTVSDHVIKRMKVAIWKEVILRVQRTQSQGPLHQVAPNDNNSAPLTDPATTLVKCPGELSELHYADRLRLMSYAEIISHLSELIQKRDGYTLDICLHLLKNQGKISFELLEEVDGNEKNWKISPQQLRQEKSNLVSSLYSSSAHIFKQAQYCCHILSDRKLLDHIDLQTMPDYHCGLHCNPATNQPTCLGDNIRHTTGYYWDTLYWVLTLIKPEYIGDYKQCFIDIARHISSHHDEVIIHLLEIMKQQLNTRAETEEEKKNRENTQRDINAIVSLLLENATNPRISSETLTRFFLSPVGANRMIKTILPENLFLLFLHGLSASENTYQEHQSIRLLIAIAIHSRLPDSLKDFEDVILNRWFNLTKLEIVVQGANSAFSGLANQVIRQDVTKVLSDFQKIIYGYPKRLTEICSYKLAWSCAASGHDLVYLLGKHLIYTAPDSSKHNGLPKSIEQHLMKTKHLSLLARYDH